MQAVIGQVLSQHLFVINHRRVIVEVNKTILRSVALQPNVQRLDLLGRTALPAA